MSNPPAMSIVNVAVFDGVSEQLIDGPLGLADGQIVEIGGTTGADDLVLDAGGGVALPGLIDAHFHAYGVSLDLRSIETAPLSYLALEGARRLRGALGRGFTTVRDVAGGDPGLARSIAEGLIAAPRYLYTGPGLSQTGGHGDPRSAEEVELCCGGHLVQVVDGVDGLRRATRDRFRRGAHAIKIMASGGVMSLTDPINCTQYSADEVRAVTDEADRRHSYVAAHAYTSDAVRHCVENGVRSIEHGNLIDAPTAALMAEHDAFLVPTLATYDAMDRRGDEVGMAAVSKAKNREVLDAGRQAVTTARAAGVRIGFGTDLMGMLEDEQLNGLRLQVEVEGPLRALQSATSVNAELLGRPDLGHIRVGAAADVLVVNADPFKDPSVLWGPPERRTVIQAGRPI
jgi:imidazolonepropionase-like amidohydrolase